MEIRRVIKFHANINDTIRLCRSWAGKHYGCRKRPTAIIFKHRQYVKRLIILFSLGVSGFPNHRQINADDPLNFIIHELIEQYFDPESPQLW